VCEGDGGATGLAVGPWRLAMISLARPRLLTEPLWTAEVMARRASHIPARRAFFVHQFGDRLRSDLGLIGLVAEVGPHFGLVEVLWEADQPLSLLVSPELRKPIRPTQRMHALRPALRSINVEPTMPQVDLCPTCEHSSAARKPCR
jgi:hypothetical protein